MSHQTKCYRNFFISPIRTQSHTEKNLSSNDFRIRYKAYRSFSSNYIHKRDVRKYLLDKYNHKCAMCGSSENLHIDHVIDVLTCAKEKVDIVCTNCERNLRVLCSK